MDFSEAADADIVLDYLWGDVAKTILPGIVAKRKDKSQGLTWIEIGALGGDGLQISGALLRSARVALLGCGPGSWTFPELHAQMPAMPKCMVANKLDGEHTVVNLPEIEQ